MRTIRTSWLAPLRTWGLAALLGSGLVLPSGCDSAQPEAPTPTVAPTQPTSKLRHAHLLDRATRSAPSFARGTAATDSVGLIVQLDTYRVFSRYGKLDPYRVFSRYASLEEYRVFSRYFFDDAFFGFAVTVPAEYLADLLARFEGDDEVLFVEPDIQVYQSPLGLALVAGESWEHVGWGVVRIGGGTRSASNVDLFVVDTGVEEGDVAMGAGSDFTGHAAPNADLDGHGTHIATTAAGLNNGSGVRGVAPGAVVRSLRVLTGDEVSDPNEPVDLSAALMAIEHVTAYKLANPNRPVVVNFSLGADVGTTAYNALDEAIEKAIANGVTVVVAAGNSGIDARTVTPAHVAEAITVGAYDEQDRFAAYSNRGSIIDLLAPGSNVLSLVDTDHLALFSGTSMAAAHASGAAALFLASNPNASPQQVRDGLVNGGQPVIQQVPAGTTNRTVFVGGVNMQVPPFFQYAITTDSNLLFNNSVTIKPEKANGTNASVFANGNLEVTRSGVVVNGFGYFAGERSGSMSAFAPAYNPSNAARFSRQPQIEVPDFSVYAYRDKATRIVTSNLRLTGGTLALGTREQPAIVLIEGNLVVDGPTTVTGYGILLVKGDVEMNQTLSTPASSETKLGIYAEGNIYFDRGGWRLDAQLFAKGNVDFRAYGSLYGNVTVGGNVLFSRGGTTIFYRPASPALTEPLWPMNPTL